MTIPAALRAKLNAQAQESCPVLTVDEFFEGNHDLGSIGCNLSPAPPLEVFRRVLLGIAARPDVQSVLVRVTEDMGDEWPFSDQVFVLTSVPVEEVGAWLAELQPEDPYVAEEWSGPTTFLPALRPGMRPVVAWWD